MARELPIARLRFPVGLLNEKNGQLSPGKLASIEPYGRLYKKTAAIAWRQMRAAAREDGIALKPTSSFDTYRPYSVQKAVFLQRYSPDPIPNRPVRIWEHKRYYQKPNTAAAAIPGRSNHGWGLAVDIWNVSKNGRLEWLLANARRFGFSWELQSEPWHLRYILGDDLP